MPPRVRLSFKQKQDIRNEHNRRTVQGLRTDQHDLAEWAKKTFKLSKAPGQATISRILKEENQDNAFSARYRNGTGAYPEFKKALLEWILAQFSSRIAINGPMIIEAGRRIIEKMNVSLDAEEKIKLSLSNGWLYNFQKRHNLRSFKSHGESGDADDEAIQANLESLRGKVESYAIEDRYNADEFGLFHCMAPDRTIAQERLDGRKKAKVRMSFLACANSDGSDRMPLLIIGKAKRPRCFKKKTGQELGFDYHNNAKAWMTGAIFLDWLSRFSAHISASSSSRKVLLLLDNASVHGNLSVLPTFENVEVSFLPANTTSKIQPMDAGIIAAVKKRYKRFLYKRAVDNIDISIDDIYKVDQLSAMRELKHIWEHLPNGIFWNCWLHTKLMDGVKITDGLNTMERTIVEEIVGFVNELVRSRAHGRISIESLLNGEEKDRECLSMPGIDEIVSNALQSIAEEDTDEQDEDEDISFIEELSVDDQLAYIAVALLILENQDRARGAGAAELRSAQRDLRRERASSMQQTRISSFFAHE